MKEDIKLLYVDLFCGAGGTSTGVEKGENEDIQTAKVIACVNHDSNAIASHKSNHPDAMHFIEDIRTLEISKLIPHLNLMRFLYPEAKVVLWASLECTNFSKAKGGQSRDADSRTLAEHLYRYVEAIDPDYIQVENVEEFLTYGPLIVKVKKDKKGNDLYCPLTVKTDKKTKKKVYYPTWVPDPQHKGEYFEVWKDHIRDYGYDYEHKILMAADYGARTTRARYFGVFAKCGLPICWPKPTHSKEGKGGKEKWLPVKDVLDLYDEGTSIFEKPVCENTEKRIYAGLIQFVAGGKENFMIKYNSMSQSGKYKAPDLDAPCPTVTAQGRLGLASVSFLSKAYSGHPESKNIPLTAPAGSITTVDHHQFVSAYYGNGFNRSVNEPSPTVSTKDRFALVSPIDKQYLMSYNYKDAPRSLLNPAPTIMTKDRFALVSTNFLDHQYGKSKPTSLDNPSGTITANPKQNLVSCNPWLMDTNFGNVGRGIDKPSPVITANRKWHYLMNPQYNNIGRELERPCFTLIARMDKKPPYLITSVGGDYGIGIYPTDSPTMIKIKEFMALYNLVDIKKRMLKIDELLQIQGFPKSYRLKGTKTEKKKYIGNSVEVKVARALRKATVYGIDNLKLKSA